MAKPLHAIPPGVWALGLVSMLMDVSSEMIHALLPVFMVTVLGASAAIVGAIEGIAEATASLVKIVSGRLSDRLRHRKLLAAAGYALSALSKPVFPLAPSLAWLAAARFVDRVGKGIRGAPRDALVADLTPAPVRGAAFGLRQALDTIGAFAGPLIAIAVMAMSGDDYRLVFAIAVVPAVLAVGVILVAVDDPPPTGARGHSRATGEPLGGDFWRVAGFATLFTLARFSEAFLILAATARGLPAALAPAVLVAMNIAYALSSWPAGIASDRFGRRGVLAIGIALLITADLILALSGGLVAGFLAILLWGLHMGFTQGLLAAMVADAAPPARRGSAFGVFNFLTGLAALAASLAAGLLWDGAGPAASFAAGAGIAALSLVALVAIVPRPPPS